MHYLTGMRGSRDDDASFTPMTQTPKNAMESQILEEHADVASLPTGLHWLMNSESMSLQNDPRFFQDNVLGKRLSALSGMSVVSALVVNICTSVIDSRKHLTFETWTGRVRCCNFVFLSLVLFLNTVATYVPMAQAYHTYRLETAGPTGFEIASSYYLNPNIVAWRHFSVLCLLNGLTCYLFSYGVRVTVGFFEAAVPHHKPLEDGVEQDCALVMAYIVGLLYFVGGVIMLYIHRIHQAVFRTNYQLAKESERPYMQVVQDLRSRNSPNTPRV